ncbi:ribosome small subunit-dependent GTPase A [Pleionea litopenaei]|uniref:Small ribosomal subunit biogenesis GTPase RsgA n=1 Tax=Pleionea litopenaei TaxID=3070815 RepID=A0AA51RQY8_9GAMM|nr:ribosome small subunit-dependent GTPase A [Pleionea sp. HL-JVS1]WMS86043.1 ribosome small subunit-dependent GTPase A [Pleionea sp. HL-JVS1]
MINYSLLLKLGWKPFFQQQLTIEEYETSLCVRVVEQHRSELVVSNGQDVFKVPILKSTPEIVVGDWLLLDHENRLLRVLDRKSKFERKSAGTKIQKQLIASNIDTAFIVSSMNDDFNLSRIERYLALVHSSEADAVIVLTKSDLCEEPSRFVADVQNLDPLLSVVAVNALDTESISALSSFIKTTDTVCVIGSSGVGKSTLINTLTNGNMLATGSIREDDSKGRHTTTHRSLILLNSGGVIIDTPGMREIKITDSEEGISKTFHDIEKLSENCRYKDCQHQQEPGCAVKQAVIQGKLDQRRLDNFHKLVRENDLNSATLAQKRAKDKSLGRFYKKTLSESHKLKGR